VRIFPVAVARFELVVARFEFVVLRFELVVARAPERARRSAFVRASPPESTEILEMF
jgi:hypothetical protein